MPASGKRRRKRQLNYEWDAEKVKALREHLGLTQQTLSQQLGVRQQTISEWETGQYYPRGASVTLLNIVAERAQFKYAEPKGGESKKGEK